MNYETVTRALQLSPNGKTGDVLTILTPNAEVDWQTPGTGILGVTASNAGTPVAGSPFTNLDALGGTFSDEGGGSLGYTPPAPPAAWILVSKNADQASGSTSPINDTQLVTPTLPAGTYRFRINIWMNATGAGGFDASVALPAHSFLRGRNTHQDMGSGSFSTGGNIGATVPAYSNGNAGDGWLYFEAIIVTSAPGVIQLQWDAQNGGNTVTVFAGSYLEYMAVA